VKPRRIGYSQQGQALDRTGDPVTVYVAHTQIACFGCARPIRRGDLFSRQQGSMGDGKRLNVCRTCRPFGEVMREVAR
jgi:hypothetical protein